MSVRYIASVSFGKDSLAMLLRLMDENMPLDEVVFYDTGMEFQAIYDTRDKVLPMLQERGIKYTELKPTRPFVYEMVEKPVFSKKNGHHLGYSWCGGCARWGTAEKTKALDSVAGKREQVVRYIGIAADEKPRLERLKQNQVAPLSDWGMSEEKCLAYCYDRGFQWVEDSGSEEVKLYDVLDRVSCWCCANKNLKELRNIYHYLPSYWNQLKDLQSQLDRPMKGCGKSVFQLETRFALEDQWIIEGKSITGREFHLVLKRLLDEVSL